MVFELAALSTTFLFILLFIIFWSAFWKGISLWKAGRNDQLCWFIFLFIIHTAGILDILYLLFFQRKKKR